MRRPVSLPAAGRRWSVLASHQRAILEVPFDANFGRGRALPRAASLCGVQGLSKHEETRSPVPLTATAQFIRLTPCVRCTPRTGMVVLLHCHECSEEQRKIEEQPGRLMSLSRRWEMGRCAELARSRLRQQARRRSEHRSVLVSCHRSFARPRPLASELFRWVPTAGLSKQGALARVSCGPAALRTFVRIGFQAALRVGPPGGRLDCSVCEPVFVGSWEDVKRICHCCGSRMARVRARANFDMKIYAPIYEPGYRSLPA